MNFYDIPGYEGIYKISKTGVVISLPRKRMSGNGFFITTLRILKPQINTHGYKSFRLIKDGLGKNSPLHRILGVMFKSNPNKLPCLNHKDGVKTNNKLSNLEWCTHLHNNRHAERMGLSKHPKKITILHQIENNKV